MCNIQDFIIKAKNKFGYKFNYDLAEYNGSQQSIKIVCSTHGIFATTPNQFLHPKKMYGCSKCGIEARAEKQKSKNYIENFKKIHGDRFDYSLVDYKNNSTKIKIICKKHGAFEQTPGNHLHGVICPNCAKEESAVKRTSTTDIFKKRALIIHRNKFNYSLADYKGAWIKVKIICKKHGVFEQYPNNHLSGGGCFICKESRNEILISNLLKDSKINFLREHRFIGCKNIKTLPFDFYLPDLKTCIEFDGKHHFEPINYYGGIKTLMNIRKRDQAKTKYCKDTGLNLIRISYKEDIIKKLKNVL